MNKSSLKKRVDSLKDKEGIWRTIGGRRIFIAEGQSLDEAMKSSGKFKEIEARNKLRIPKKDTIDGEGEGGQSSGQSNGKSRTLTLKQKYQALRDEAQSYVDREKQRDELARKFRPRYSNTQQKHDMLINELSKDNYGDGTYDLSGLNKLDYDSGFQVTFSQIGDDYDNETYSKLVEEFLTNSSDGRVCAGKFEGTPEISFNFKDKDKAIEFAKKYNQISIWDWQNCEEIKTGGTGRRLKLIA